MLVAAIAVLAAVTFAFRLAGPAFHGRAAMPARTRELLASVGAILLLALTATSALTQGRGFAGWARPAGVAAAGLLAARRAPFPLVVITAVAVTALLRLAGAP